MPEEEKEDEKAPAKKGPPKLLFIVIGGMVVLAVAAFVVVKFVFAPAKNTEEVDPAAEALAAPKKVESYLFSFEKAIVVNLAETNGQRYLKVNLQLEMSKQELQEELTARLPQLMDLIISILSSKTIEDASTTVGRNRLKRELIDRVNAELVTGKVINIFFTEFVIQ